MKKENLLLAQGDNVNGQDLIVVKSAGKLEKLNDLQLAKMKEIKQFWLNYIFSCKNSIDKEKAKTGIEWLYKLAGHKNPIIVYVDTPMGCQLAADLLKKLLKGDTVGASVRDSVRDSVGDSV